MTVKDRSTAKYLQPRWKSFEMTIDTVLKRHLMFLNFRLPSWQNDPFELRVSRFWTSFYHPPLHRTRHRPGELQDAGIITWDRSVCFRSLFKTEGNNCFAKLITKSWLSPRPLLSWLLLLCTIAAAGRGDKWRLKAAVISREGRPALACVYRALAGRGNKT